MLNCSYHKCNTHLESGTNIQTFANYTPPQKMQQWCYCLECLNISVQCDLARGAKTFCSHRERTSVPWHILLTPEVGPNIVNLCTLFRWP